jgi:predicted Zn-dependent protease
MLWIERLSHGEAVYETAATNSAANAEAEKCIKNNIESVTKLLIHLPNSRKNEHEADLIGLKLAAIAGYPLTAGIDAIKALDSLGKGQAPNAMVTRMVGQHYNHAHAEIFKYL